MPERLQELLGTSGQLAAQAHDPELAEGLDELIRTGRYSAGYALRLQRDRLAAVFDGIDDPYLRSRREDIDHVIGRVYAALHSEPLPQVIGLAGEVLVCDNVAPSELALLHEEGVVAIVTAQGSPLSHSAILARSLHMPLLVGAHEALLQAFGAPSVQSLVTSRVQPSSR